MVVSLWLVLNLFRKTSSSKPAPVYHRIWTAEGSPIDPLIAHAVRSI
jgi:hypothetical protein